MNDRSLQGQYAGFVSRAVGLAIDVLISTVSVAIVSWFLITVMGLFGINVTNCPRGDSMTYWWSICYISSIMLVSFAALFFPVYLLLFWTLAGETPGMRVMGVRVVRRDGRRVNLWVAIKRLFGYFVCFFTLGLGFLWVLLDDQRQGLHDMIAGTVVIYAWNARLRTQFITRMQRKALRAKTTAEVAREFGVDAWAGRDYHTITFTSTNTDQLEELCDRLIVWYRAVPPQVLIAITLTKDETGRMRMTEISEILPPTTAVMASNPSIPRQDDVRGEVFRVMNALPDNHSALFAVIDWPLVAQVVQMASDAEVTLYKGGWARSQTTVAVESIAKPETSTSGSETTAVSVAPTPALDTAIAPVSVRAAEAAASPGSATPSDALGQSPPPHTTTDA